MFAKKELVRTRRIKRRFKAAASIVIAVAAGTFLACQRGVEYVKTAIDAPSADGGDDGPNQLTGHASDAGHDAAGDATEALAIYSPKDNIRDAAVDVDEHRKGMPVIDNLLE